MADIVDPFAPPPVSSQGGAEVIDPFAQGAPPPPSGQVVDPFAPARVDQPMSGQGNAVTDIWPEVKRSAVESWQGVAENLGPAAAEKYAEEARAAPFWDLAPAVRSVGRTGLGLLSGVAAPFNIAAGLVRAPLAHGLASASRLAGSKIAPGADEPYQDTYERMRLGVDTALAAVRPVGRPVVTRPATPPGPYEGPTALVWDPRSKPAQPPQPPQEGPLGVTLSKGEADRSLPDIQMEQGALRGELGVPATKRAQQFQEQRAGQLAGARERVSDELGEVGVPSVSGPQGAGDVVTGSLARSRAAEEAAVRGSEQALTAAHDATRARLSPTGQVLARDPLEAADIVSGSVAQASENAQAATTAAYTRLRDLDGRFRPTAFNTLSQDIRTKLNAGENPVRVDPQRTPQAEGALRDLDEVLGSLRQPRDPATGRIMAREEPLTPAVVERARQRLNTFYGDALQSARSSQNWSDVRATRAVVDEFDRQVLGRLGGGQYIGADPADAVAALQAARRSYSEYRNTFTPRGPGDAVGRDIQTILGRHEGTAAPPEQILTMLYGKGARPVQIANRLVQIFGRGSPEIGAVRQGLYSFITERPPGTQVWGPVKIADRIDEYTRGPGRTLTQAYLTQGEISELQNFGRALRQHDARATALADDPLRGLDIGALFRGVVNQSPAALENLSELARRLPQGSAELSVLRQGLFLHALQPVEGVAKQGTKVTGDQVQKLLVATRNSNLYSPGRRAALQAYVNLMRQLEVPTAGANWPGTAGKVAPMLERISKLVTAGMTLGLGHLHFGFGLPELAAYGTFKAFGKLSDRARAKEIAKNLPLVSDQVIRYQRALSAHNRAGSPGTEKLLGFATSNLARSLQGVGIDISKVPLQLPGTAGGGERDRAAGGAVDEPGPDLVLTGNNSADVPGDLVDAVPLPAPVYPSLPPDQAHQGAPGTRPAFEQLGLPPGGIVSEEVLMGDQVGAPQPGAPEQIFRWATGQKYKPEAGAEPPVSTWQYRDPASGELRAMTPNKMIFEDPAAKKMRVIAQPPGGYGVRPEAGGTWRSFDRTGTRGADGAAFPSYEEAARDAYERSRQVSQQSAAGALVGSGGPRFQTWPEQAVRHGFSAPGEALAGRLQTRDPYQDAPSDEAIQRSMDVAGLGMSGGIGSGGAGSVASGFRIFGKTPEELGRATSRAVRDIGTDRVSPGEFLRRADETPQTQSHPDVAGSLRKMGWRDDQIEAMTPELRAEAARTGAAPDRPVARPGPELLSESGKPGAPLAALGRDAKLPAKYEPKTLPSDIQAFVDLSRSLEAKHGPNWLEKLPPDELKQIQENPAIKGALANIEGARELGVFDQALQSPTTRRELFSRAAGLASVVTNASRLGKLIEVVQPTTVDVASQTYQKISGLQHTYSRVRDEIIRRFDERDRELAAAKNNQLETLERKYYRDPIEYRDWESIQEQASNAGVEYFTTTKAGQRALESGDYDQALEDWMNTSDAARFLNRTEIQIAKEYYYLPRQVRNHRKYESESGKIHNEDSRARNALIEAKEAELEKVRSQFDTELERSRGTLALPKLSPEQQKVLDSIISGPDTLRRGSFGLVNPEAVGDASSLLSKMTPDQRVQIAEHIKPALLESDNLTVKELRQLAEVFPSLKGFQVFSESGKAGAPLAALGRRDPLYSAVERLIERAPQQKMHAQQWVNWLKNQPGVRREELEVLGLDDPASLPAGVVTRDQVLEHARGRRPQFKIVEKRGPLLNEENIGDLANKLMDERHPNVAHDDSKFWGLYDEMLVEAEQMLRGGGTEGYGFKGTGSPRYGDDPKLQLPGGTNYRETLIRLGGRSEPSFSTSHWDELDVLLWTRTNDREIPGIGKSLHVEEIQSDWHQTGREKGYKVRQDGKFKIEKNKDGDWDVIEPQGGQSVADFPTQQEARTWADREEARGLPDGVPDAPFKSANSWAGLGLRHAVVKAAREGYDAVSWTPGESQAARYDLSRQLDSIKVIKRNNGNYDIEGSSSSRNHNLGSDIPPDKVYSYVGKDLSEKIRSQKEKMHEYTGIDLKVGGEGMRTFYDKILVNKANDIGRRYGAKVEWRDLPVQSELTGVLQRMENQSPLTPTQRADYDELKSMYLGEGSVKIPVLRLTPELKHEAVERGLPLFSESGKVGAPVSALGRKPGEYLTGGRQGLPQVVTKDQISTVIDFLTTRYDKINRSARGDIEATPKIQKIIDNLDQVIGNSTLRVGTYHRGDTRDLNLKKGDTFSPGSFMSAYRGEPDTALEHATDRGTIFSISTAKGTPGLDVERFHDFSTFTPSGKRFGRYTDGEVIFPRDSKFEVTSVRELDDGQKIVYLRPVSTSKSSDPISPAMSQTERRVAPHVAPLESQHSRVDGLLQYLDFTSKMRPADKSTDRFILENGQPYFATPKTYAGKRETPKQCYRNAACMALDDPGLTYVEGYISVHGIPVAHAWVVGRDGVPIDPTIKPGVEVSGYFGVPFSTDYLAKTLLKNKIYGLLDYQSRETLPDLLEGRADWRAELDTRGYSPQVVEEKIKVAERRMRAMEPTDKIDTLARHELRQKIEDQLYERGIGRRTRNREATIVIGLPASGKSTLIKSIVKRGVLEIEGDNAKMMLPEFQGGPGAWAVHEESSGIMRRVLKRARDAGDDIMWARIDSPEKIVNDIKQLKDKGYTVHLKMLDVPVELAKETAVHQFLRTNRYVSPEQIGEYGSSVLDAYRAGEATGLLDSSEMYYRDRPGIKETLVERDGKKLDQKKGRE